MDSVRSSSSNQSHVDPDEFISSRSSVANAKLPQQAEFHESCSPKYQEFNVIHDTGSGTFKSCTNIMPLESNNQNEDAVRSQELPINLAEKLNFTSDQFDPVEVLRADIGSITLPKPDAIAFNNLSEYEQKSFAKTTASNQPVSKAKQKVKPGSKSEETIKMIENTMVTVPVRKESKTVLTICRDIQGPLAFLRGCMNKRIRVMLRRRKINFQGLHRFSNLYGYLIIFDKHGNLVMSHATERIKLTNPAEQEGEICRRHGTIFVRGSNIVLVTLAAAC
ncbi:uncharacterized protein LOC141854168 [Brevipalpus obovatus]|uniref:uncharacterized protein LOC141854168 n=1 Tax=Brevipalpus obovatus TaxID=246614 RepID=UPI003D9E8EBA